MIYDAFLFFNEIDLLKIRLEELKDTVDTFVLLEATKTFACREKPLYFAEHKHEFKEYLDKIVYFLIDDTPFIKCINRWHVEQYQRNCISKALAQCNCSDDDIILLSDADEIPRADKIEEAGRLLTGNDYVVFDQKCYVCYLNWIHRDAFCGTVATKYRTFKKAGKAHDIRGAKGAAGGTSTKERAGLVRKYAGTHDPHISNAGWHFTYFGGYDAILYKIQNFSHSELDKTWQEKIGYVKYTTCRSNLQNAKSKVDVFKAFKMQLHPHWQDFVEIPVESPSNFSLDPELPAYLKANKESYRHFFKFTEPYYEGDIQEIPFTRSYSGVWCIDMYYNFFWYLRDLLKKKAPHAYTSLVMLKKNFLLLLHRFARCRRIGAAK